MVGQVQCELDALKSDLKHISVFDDVKLEKVNIPFRRDKVAVSIGQYDENIALGKLGMVTIRENQKLKQGNEEEIRIEVHGVGKRLM